MHLNEFSTNYFKTLYESLNTINLKNLEYLIELLNKTTGRIYIIGNGGSASTASHMANDLSVGLKKQNKKSYDAISLCDNSAINFAIANDLSYDDIFYMQLKDILKKEDLLIAISCSGNSNNIIKAVEYASNNKTIVASFTGFDGGRLKKISDINIHIQTEKGEYGIVEDAHLILNHLIFSYLQEV